MSIRVLQLGTGIRGEQWAEIIRNNPDTENVGYVDTNIPYAQAQLAKWGESAPVYSDLEQAITDLKPDMAVIATPPEYHLEECRSLFNAGIHVLCEKPLTETLCESIEIVRLAEAANVTLGVGMEFRYLNVTQTFRRLITDGTMGRPSFSLYSYERNRDPRRRDLNKYPITMKQPMLLEQSIHHFDLFRYCFADEVKAVRCDTWRPEWSHYNDHPCVAALMEFNGGLHMNYHGTWTTAWNVPTFFWRTDCANGVLYQKEIYSDLYRTYYTKDLAIRLERSSWMIDNEKRFEPQVEIPVDPDVPFFDDSAKLLAEFVGALEGKCEFLTTGKDHLKTMAVTLACVEASETGERVVMEDFYKRSGIPSKWL